MAQDGLRQSWGTELTSVSTTALEELGALRFQGGKWYKYVQYSEATVAGTALNMTAYLSYSSNTVTCDYSDAITAEGGVGAGQLQATTAHLSYCWIQIKGLSQAFPTDFDAGAIGNAMTIVGATDATLDVNAAVTSNVCGAAQNVTTTTCAAILDCPF